MSEIALPFRSFITKSSSGKLTLNTSLSQPLHGSTLGYITTDIKFERDWSFGLGALLGDGHTGLNGWSKLSSAPNHLQDASPDS